MILDKILPYIPYNVKAYYEKDINFKNGSQIPFGSRTLTLGNLSDIIDENKTNDFKLLLRPMSDITKLIEVDGEKFYPIGKLHNSSYRMHGKTCKGEYKVDYMALQYGTAITTTKHSFSYGVTVHPYDYRKNFYWVNKYLLKWNFDIYGLIDEDKAIDLNVFNPRDKKKHYCADWDFMQIDNTMKEFEVCTCFDKRH